MIINDKDKDERAAKERKTRKKAYLIIFLIIFIPYFLLYLEHFSLSCPNILCKFFPVFPHTIVIVDPMHPLWQCKYNLRDIATALKKYSVDNNGHFPSSLDKLVPGYLSKIPECFEAGKDTYSSSYQFCNSNKYKFTFTMDGKKYYKYSMEIDTYTFYCSGSFHTKYEVGPNYPRYSSRRELVEK